MEAQRYPNDFDGISAGAAVMRYEALNAGHTWLLQRTFRDKLGPMMGALYDERLFRTVD